MVGALRGFPVFMQSGSFPRFPIHSPRPEVRFRRSTKKCPMNPRDKTILVVDDDPNLVKAVTIRLRADGYQVLTAGDGVEALAIAETRRPDLIVADIWMPVGVGLSLAHLLRETAPDIPIIFLTAGRQPKLREMASEVGAAAFLEKPYSPEVLLATVAGVLRTSAPAYHPVPDDI